MVHIKTIAQQYRNIPGKEFPHLFDFQRWIGERFHLLPVTVEYVEYDPYPHRDIMRTEVAATGILRISVLNNHSIFDPEINLMFRAVHDYDHIRSNGDFSANGERLTGRVMMGCCGDEWGRSLIFSEIIAQACAALYYEAFEAQKFVPFSQKIIDDAVFNGFQEGRRS